MRQEPEPEADSLPGRPFSLLGSAACQAKIWGFYTLLTAQSFHGSNSASPAIATANGRNVCNTFVEAA
jgi:hypothetical protein